MRPTKMLLPLLFGSLLTQQTTATPNTSSATQFKKTSSLYFIENKGQIVDQHHNPRTDIDFKIPAGNGLNIFIGAGKIHYQWSQIIENGELKIENDPASSLNPGRMIIRPYPSSLMMYRMDVTLLNSNPNAEVVTEEQQSYYEQYYTTHTGADGATAYTYRKITYKDVYPHIDWVFRINDQGKLEHDFIVHPGGKVSDIQLQYGGADNIQHNVDGSVTATTAFGTVTENTPYCFGEDGKPVAGKFVLTNTTLGFVTASHSGTLIIDPVLEWATYFGGAAKDQINKLHATGKGIVYITGITESSNNIATTGSFQQTYNAAEDAFVAKFDQAGTCIWATYYGSTATELAFDISCDPWENVYISGATSSDAGVATPGAHQTVFGGGSFDAFLLKLDSSGRRIWCTYYGGEFDDYSSSSSVNVVCDKWGSIYLAGSTNSVSGISTPGAHQVSKLGSAIRYDAFLARFDTSGQRIWGTYFGGTDYEYTGAIACDTFGHVFISGRTNSSSITGISAAAHQSALSGQYDFFLAMFDSTGTVHWGTYYGGSAQELLPVAIACDPHGHVYLAGTTSSTDQISTPGSIQPVAPGGGTDAFLTKFDTTGKRFWGSYYGGEGWDYGYALTCNLESHIYLAGYTNSTTGIATTGSLQSTNNGMNDFYIVKIDSGGTRSWASYYGSTNDEYFSVSVQSDRMGNVYVSGSTESITGVATTGSHQPTIGGGMDGLLVKISDCDLYAPDTITGPVFVCRGATDTYAVEPMPGVQSYIWTLPASWQGSSTTDSITVIVGRDTDTIRVAAEFFCGTGPEQVLVVTVSPEPAISVPAGTALCAGDSIELHANLASGMSWQWMRDGIDIVGETDSVLHTTQSGSYRVITTVAHCTDTSEPVVVHPLPQPGITQDGNTLSTEDHYASYQWYYGTQSITGANQRSYTYAAEGDYRVEVVDTNGCMGMSEAFTPVGVRELGSNQTVLVYPNPAQSTIRVDAVIPVSVVISGMDGREVMRTTHTSRIDIGSLAEGLYLLQVQDDVGAVVHIEKLVKLARQ